MPSETPTPTEREETLARIAASQPFVPEHLHGKLFSSRDLIEPAFKRIDEQMAPWFAKSSAQAKRVA